MPRRKPIVTVADYFTPAVRAGGPIPALKSQASLMRDDYRFWMITRDRDLGDAAPYPGIDPARWYRRGGVPVRYIQGVGQFIPVVRGMLRRFPEATLYLNSLFSPLTRAALLSASTRVICPARIVLAPRGELSQAAMNWRRGRKEVYLRVIRHLPVLKGIAWQASSDHEVDDIRAAFPRAVITQTRELSVIDAAGLVREAPKEAGSLSLVTVGRILPHKNQLAAIQAACEAGGRIRLEVVGPVEDHLYWEHCLAWWEQHRGPEMELVHRGVLSPPEVAATLVKSDLFISPTQGENFGHAIAEALQAGCPVLVSDQTPWRDLDVKRAGADRPLDDLSQFAERLSAFREMGDEEHRGWREGAKAVARDMSDVAEIKAQTRKLFG